VACVLELLLYENQDWKFMYMGPFYSWQDMCTKTSPSFSFSQVIYCSLFSAAFQLTTSHTAEKYSALRFWYCR
jgi:hypothetical protein